MNNINNENTDLINNLINATSENINEFSLNGLKTIGKIVDCYDGDTCKIVLVINNKLAKYNCRLMGIDAPEMKPLLSAPNRTEEIAMACKCRNRLLQLGTNCFTTHDINDHYGKKEIKNLLDLNTKIIGVECLEFDKYGRLLVYLHNVNPNIDIMNTNIDIIDNEQISYNQQLILEKLVKQYNGGTKEAF